MRILLTSFAWPTHYYPLVPLLWALRGAGHEVHVASQPKLAGPITDSGGIAVRTGIDLDHDQVRRERMRDLKFSGVPEAPPPGTSMRDWNPERRARVRQVFGVFTAYAEAMADDLLAHARWWQPDLIVHDPVTYAAPLVAAKLGIPTARHIHGVDVTYQAMDILPELLAPLSERLGVGDVDLAGTLTIDPCPPSMQTPADVRRLLTRYIPYNGPAVLPDWLRGPRPRPRICLTWGTSTTKLGGRDLFVPPRVIELTKDLDVEVVVSLAPHDADAIEHPPANVRLVRSLPLHLLLDSCDAVIHQGGNGTILTAALHGLPQLVLPQLPDQRFHTDRFVETGAGIGLRVEQATDEVLAKSLDAVLTDPGHRIAAAALAEEMRAMPTPNQIVPELEALAAAGVANGW